MTRGHHFGAEADGHYIPIEVHGPDNTVQKLLAAICNKAPQGGGLGKQIKEVAKRAGDIRIALIRSTAFPPAARATQVGKQLAELLKKGGRLVPVEDADWRKILALQQFKDQHGSRPDFRDWLQHGRPLGQLPSLHRLPTLDQFAKATVAEPCPPRAPSSVDGEAREPSHSAPVLPADQPFESGALLVGSKLGLAGGVVTLEPEDLKQHAAFLGGSGSGKTTAALNLIEQLLLRGVPAILVDRKGDLCRYADAAAWQEPLADPAMVERRRQLRERIAVALYTPGHPDGRCAKYSDRLPS